MARVRVCPYCGHENRPTARFCMNAACGEAIEGFEVTVTADAPPAPPLPAPPVTVPPATASIRSAPAAAASMQRAELRCASNRDLRFQVAPDAVVGRGADVDLTSAPDSRFISRRHARFYVADNRWHVEALSATNPTSVGGIAVKGTRPLVSGETVVLGRTAFVFRVLA